MTTETKPAPAPEVDENLLQHENMVFFKYVTISHPETLARFTNDLEIMKQQAKRILEINQRIQSTLTSGEKDALTKVRDTELASFNEKDELFAKVYGFKVDNVAMRPHFVQNTEIQLLSPVTDEQIAEFRKNPSFKETDILARGNQKMISLCKMTGDHIPLFERNAQIVAAQQQALIQLRAADQQTKEADAKKRIADEIAKITDILTKNAEELNKNYGIFTNNIVFDVLVAKFWVALTQDELKAYFERKQSDKAGAPAPVAAVEAPKAEKKSEKK